MLNPKQASALDQSIAMMREFYPAAMWALYEGSLEKGFTQEQAMDIAKHWLALMIMKPLDPPQEDWKES